MPNIPKAAAALSFLICGLLLAGCGGAQSRLERHMQRGQEYFAQQNYAKASLEFRNALQISPKDANARVMAGRTAERLGQFGPAFSLYQAVVDTDSGNAQAAASLGRLLSVVGQPQNGLNVIEPALKKHPDDPELLTSRSVAKLALHDQAGAVADVDRALQLAPTNEDAVALRANLYRQAGDSDGAAALINATLRKLPDNTSLREVLVMLYGQKEPQKAEEQLRALVKMRPAELRYRNQLAQFYASEHRIDAAQQVLDEAAKALPDSDAAKLALVDYVASVRTAAQAEQMLRGYIAKSPDNYPLRLHLGALLQAAEKPADAMVVYREVIKRVGTEPAGLTARNRIAGIDASKNQWQEASSLIAEVLQKNPRDTDALALRGRFALEHHDLVAAIADFRAVLRDVPKAVSIQRLLARAYEESGQAELAADSLRAARQTSPLDNTLRIELAQVLLQLHHNDECVKLLEEGVRSTPTDTPLREALVRAYIANGNFAAARTSAQDLKTLRPEAATGWLLAGLAAQSDHQPEEAEKQFEQALVLQPRSLEVLSALARLDIARKHPEQAIARIRSAIDRDSNGYLWNLLGELYLSQKNLPAANDALAHAVQLSPTWWTPHRTLALAKLVSNDLNGAVNEYEQAIKAAPGEISLVAELAGVLERQGRIEDALKLYETTYAATHSRAVANNLAMLLVTQKSDRQSLDRARDLTSAFDTATESDFLDTTGWVHYKRAEYADALPTLERAAQRAPASPVIRFHLGMAELQVGRTERARADLQAALSGSQPFPGMDEARTALASIKSGAG